MRQVLRPFALLSCFCCGFFFSNAQTGLMDLDNYPVYTGNDLGVSYSPTSTRFIVWAPTATEVKLRLYTTGTGDDLLQTVDLAPGSKGSWRATVPGNLRNRYYTFTVRTAAGWLQESADPYARAVGLNGKRGMIVHLPDTDPAGWKQDRGPIVKSMTDVILYETHVRDLSIHPQSGIRQKGKFPGLAESGTRGPGGLATGLDHIAELGITHVHLLPAFDFNSIDESTPEKNAYNWGYDPLHYNAPEGSFSTNAADGRVRIREFKQMVQALHSKGIGVVMDVVYNHTSNLRTPFNQFVPRYYYRQRPDGSYSDASACGNETASERPMMRRFMIESLVYWVKEYHIDGFRFDLMGIHDTETMNAISDTLHRLNPSIVLYGEGWTAGASPLDESKRAVKKNTFQLRRIAAFSDDIRDGLRGPYSNTKENGFAGGKTGTAESVRFGIAGAVSHPQVQYAAVAYSKAPWAADPSQSINYVSCHDDPTLFDRLQEANPGADEAALIRMDLLAQTVVFTSQGVAFLHAGAEMLRTKQGVHNSFNAPDSINQIDWTRKQTYKRVYTYYRGLVALRRSHPAFRLPTAALVRQHLRFIDTNDPLLIGWRLDGVKGDPWQHILVLANGEAKEKSAVLPPGTWQLAVDGAVINQRGLRSVTGSLLLPPTTAIVLFRY